MRYNTIWLVSVFNSYWIFTESAYSYYFVVDKNVEPIRQILITNVIVRLSLTLMLCLMFSFFSFLFAVVKYANTQAHTMFWLLRTEMNDAENVGWYWCRMCRSCVCVSVFVLDVKQLKYVQLSTFYGNTNVATTFKYTIQTLDARTQTLCFTQMLQHVWNWNGLAYGLVCFDVSLPVRTQQSANQKLAPCRSVYIRSECFVYNFAAEM